MDDLQSHVHFGMAQKHVCKCVLSCRIRKSEIKGENRIICQWAKWIYSAAHIIQWFKVAMRLVQELISGFVINCNATLNIILLSFWELWKVSNISHGSWNILVALNGVPLTYLLSLYSTSRNELPGLSHKFSSQVHPLLESFLWKEQPSQDPLSILFLRWGHLLSWVQDFLATTFVVFVAFETLASQERDFSTKPHPRSVMFVGDWKWQSQKCKCQRATGQRKRNSTP